MTLRTLARRALKPLRSSSQSSSVRYAIVDRGPFTMLYRPGTPDEDVLFRESFDKDQYFSVFPDLHLGARDVVVDIGAHVGGFAILAASRAGRVLAVEASRSTFDVLTANKHLNGAKNLTTSHLALTDGPGPVRLFDSPDGNWGASMTPHGSGVYELVDGITLERYLEIEFVHEVALLKCNAEGAEFSIFLSMSKERLHSIARLIVLYHEDLAPKHSKEELLDRFRTCGFDANVILEQNEFRGAIRAVRQ
jgi:FkbM family methyltransferase